MTRLSRRAARGFTLIEVLVALAIVAITLGAGIKAAGALINNTQRLIDVTTAQWCADNQLAGLRLAGLAPPVGDSDFSCVQLGKTYNGKLVARPTANPNFRKVDVQMLDDAGQVLLDVATVMRSNVR